MQRREKLGREKAFDWFALKREQAHAHGFGRRMGLVVHAELLHHVLNVEVHGALGDVEDAADLPGGLARRRPTQDLDLAVGERDRRRHEVVAPLERAADGVVEVIGEDLGFVLCGLGQASEVFVAQL